MEIIKSILTNNPCYKAGRKITVKGLMLHSVGCSQPKASVFINSWNQASYSNACVHAFIDGNDGKIYQTLPWNHRGWHGGGSSNDTHIGVEMCEPDCIKYTSGSSFTISNKTKAKESVKKTYNSAVELFAYLCGEYNLNPLTDIVSHREGYRMGIATNHGDPEHLWQGVGLSYTMDSFRQAVKKAMRAPETAEETLIKEVGPKFTADQKKTGVLASVSLAQFILESGWGKSELYKNANNGFGMKTVLSGNTWSGSTWDGKSVYTKETKEEENGKTITITADFRKYTSLQQSIEDHSAYLLGAKNGKALRYKGLKNCNDYKKAINIIKTGGYATDSKYEKKICDLIEKYNLTQYDYKKTEAKKEFKVKVSSNYLRIRKTPEFDDDNITGKFTGKGIFTIVEQKGDWGRLKSGAGWIYLKISCVSKIG